MKVDETQVLSSYDQVIFKLQTFCGLFYVSLLNTYSYPFMHPDYLPLQSGSC